MTATDCPSKSRQYIVVFLVPMAVSRLSEINRTQPKWHLAEADSVTATQTTEPKCWEWEWFERRVSSTNWVIRTCMPADIKESMGQRIESEAAFQIIDKSGESSEPQTGSGDEWRILRVPPTSPSPHGDSQRHPFDPFMGNVWHYAQCWAKSSNDLDLVRSQSQFVPCGWGIYQRCRVCPQMQHL